MTNPGSIAAKGHNGTVTFDGDFVTTERTGFLARASVGKGTKRIPLASITAVQWKPAGGMINGFISFTVGGGTEARSRFGSQTVDASRDENSVVITKKQMPDFEQLRTAVELAIAQRHRPVPVAPAAPAAPDLFAQLEQLGKLRDAGVLTNEEFEAKKAELLRRL
jgi:Domain of unknown function (DUF4429)/Short C-terminal domain